MQTCLHRFGRSPPYQGRVALSVMLQTGSMQITITDPPPFAGTP
jgi:hypothetical protein